MHIPDGYLSPETAAAMYVASVPIWLRATHKVKQVLSGRTVPLVAVFAAFSFIIMMFNVPLPGGTTGHAVGATLAAIVLGPWTAVLTTSIALVIQALFFGDGGILALGANVFNMGVVIPFVGYYIYRWLAGAAATASSRRAIAAAVAGYVAINAAALFTGIELGIQPLLFHDAGGHPLYFPYPLAVSIPAMLIGHLTVAGVVEAAVSGLVIAWLQRSNPQLLDTYGKEGADATRTVKIAWAAILVLVILTPGGLLAPGTAWGEWSRVELQHLGLGYIPAGFDRFAGVWSAPLAGYDIAGLNNPTVGYILSAVLGVGLLILVLFALGWAFDRFEGRRGAAVRGDVSFAQSAKESATARQLKGRAQGFAEKTLGDLSGALEHTLFAEEVARQDGLMQSLDPRVKLLGALALLFAVSLSHNLLIIAGLYLLTLPVAAASHVPMGFYLKRVWVFMPFFTGIIALPALFNVFTPGAPLVTLVDLATPRIYLAVTLPGLITAAFLLLRVGTSVSIGVLLILTTRWTSLLRSLRVLNVPQSFVLILGMTYRYIYVFLHAANDMFLARKSRMVGRLSQREDRKWLAASMGTLLGKSYDLSDEVYLAMQSRGFRGEVRMLDTLTWRRRDWLWLSLFLIVSAIAVWLGRN
jgi:cobalt/nickel transport system permease protein